MTDYGTNDDPTQRDYPAIILPEDIPKTEWDVNQRRKYIMTKFEDVYSPKDLNKTELAKEFDVSQRTIYNDLSILREWYEIHLDKDFEQIANRTIRWAIKELREQDEAKDAVDVTMSWQEFLQEEGEKDKQPDKVEFTGGTDIVHASVDDQEDED
jgi:transposase